MPGQVRALELVDAPPQCIHGLPNVMAHNRHEARFGVTHAFRLALLGCERGELVHPEPLFIGIQIAHRHPVDQHDEIRAEVQRSRQKLHPGLRRRGIEIAGWRETLIAAGFRGEQRYRLPDGTPRDAEVLRTALQVRNRWLMVVATRDITDRKQQQARATLLSRAFDLGNDLTLIVDRESMRYVDCNEAACRYHGMTRHDLLQVPPWALWSNGRTRENLERQYDDAIAASPLPRRHIAPAAGLRAGAQAMVEMQQQASRMDGRWMLVITARDVRDLRRNEDAIRQKVAELTRSNDELKQFAYLTSHDLVEPLRMMSSYSELLRRRYGDRLDSDGRDFIEFIASSAHCMKRLIDDLLLYSRMGRRPLP